MFRKLLASAAVMIALGGTVAAETFEVKTLNKGDGGTMMFEQVSLHIAAGYTFRIIPANKGHNAEFVKGMIPEGATVFAGNINEKIDVTLTKPGFYGAKCKPHWGMGVVKVIAVGDDAAPVDSFLESKMPMKAKAGFQESLSGLES